MSPQFVVAAHDKKSQKQVMSELENINPSVYKKTDERAAAKTDYNENVVDPIDEREVFGMNFVLVYL